MLGQPTASKPGLMSSVSQEPRTGGNLCGNPGHLWPTNVTGMDYESHTALYGCPLLGNEKAHGGHRSETMNTNSMKSMRSVVRHIRKPKKEHAPRERESNHSPTIMYHGRRDESLYFVCLHSVESSPTRTRTDLVKQCTGPTALVTSKNVLVMVQNCMRFWAIGPHGGSYEVLRSRSRPPSVQLSRPNAGKYEEALGPRCSSCIPLSS